MTKEQAESLNLGIQINDKTLIIIETALDLVLAKTSSKLLNRSFLSCEKDMERFVTV